MYTQLVSTSTDDGILLSGAYFAAAESDRPAVVFSHGDGGHFYAPLYLNFAVFLAERGFTFLSANRRGHDLVAHGQRGDALAGYAFESVRHSVSDFAAWLEWIRGQGHKRVVLAGHSGGAVRAVYAQAKAQFDSVVAVVSVSPGEYQHARVVDCHGDEFVRPFKQAQQAIADGDPDRLTVPGVPWGSMWSARAFVDCFNEDDRYSVSNNAEDTHCPTLFVFGEVECDGPEVLPVCGLAHRLVVAADYPHVAVKQIAGANHGYLNREPELYNTVSQWLLSLD